MSATDDAIAPADKTPSELIDDRIAELGDWRGERLAQIRRLIAAADADVVEEWKWRGVPVWYHDGMVCTGESYRASIKITFAKGAGLPDPAGLFTSSLEGNVRRAADFFETDVVDEDAFTQLYLAAVARNVDDAAARAAKKRKPAVSTQ